MRQENGDCGVKAAAGMGKTMEQYSVLLVDDEEEVTQVILQKIDWESLGFHIIGSATNGVKALEMAEKYQPDVVMTDIKMPYMDGLELSGRLKRNFRQSGFFSSPALMSLNTPRRPFTWRWRSIF